MKNIEEFSGKKFRRKGQQAENDKTERVTGLGRRPREEIAKWNQMTALRFQTGGRHQTSPASLQGLSLVARGSAVQITLKSSILIILSLTMTLILKTANQSFWKTIWLVMMHHHTKFGSVIQKISSGQTFIDILKFCCDLDLEQNNPIFS